MKFKAKCKIHGSLLLINAKGNNPYEFEKLSWEYDTGLGCYILQKDEFYCPMARTEEEPCMINGWVFEQVLER